MWIVNRYTYLFSLFFAFLGVIASTKGLQCYKCNSVNTNEDCIDIVECPFDTSCLTEIRQDNGLVRITKSCKQTQACNGLQKINNECYNVKSFSVCYHCCEQDYCNSNLEGKGLFPVIKDTLSFISYIFPASTIRPTTTTMTGVAASTAGKDTTFTAQLRIANDFIESFDLEKVNLQTPDYGVTISRMAKSILLQGCGLPNFSRIYNKILEEWPTGALIRLSILQSQLLDKGWAILVVFKNALPGSATLTSRNAKIVSISQDRFSALFLNEAHNYDLSNKPNYKFTFYVENMPLKSSKSSYIAGSGLYDHSLSGKSCNFEIPTLPTIPSPTLQTTTEQLSSCIVLSGINEGYFIMHNAYPANKGVRFNAKILANESIQGSAQDWSVKLIFDQEVTAIETWKAAPIGHTADGRVWVLQSLPAMRNIENGLEFFMIGNSKGPGTPSATAMFCSGGYIPDLSRNFASLFPIFKPFKRPETYNDENPSSFDKEKSLSDEWLLRCERDVFGSLPTASFETNVSFKPSSGRVETEFDYNEILHKSILFYEAQRSGRQPDTNRIPWRGNSGLKDGCDVSHDLTGGWYDGSGRIKYGYPMASSATVLAWGMILYKDAYIEANEWQSALSMLKWATDYFVKAHTSKYEFYGQVGQEDPDETEWTRPEEMKNDRTSFLINARNPGSDLAGETSAALAAASIIYQGIDPSYSRKLLIHARQLYEFADKFRGRYDQTIRESSNKYPSKNGYKDEIVWACLWLYAATKGRKYLVECENKYEVFRLDQGQMEFSWDNKIVGIQALLSNFTGRSNYTDKVESFLEYSINELPRTPGQLAFVNEWGSNMYAANAAFIALAASTIIKTKHKDSYLTFARVQIHCMLGYGDGLRSYVVGFGWNSPSRVNHAASSCPRWTKQKPPLCNVTSFESLEPNPHVLYGALVGGTDLYGEYLDARADFIGNGVSLVYNAGFQSAVAGLKFYSMQSSPMPW